MAPKRVKKEIETFTRGDVVFAKVKGYSPWPAEITNVLSKSRYSVVFFATRETANLVYSAIFPYNDANRVKFASDRMLEKKDFAMAFVEMEAKVRKQKKGKQKDINQNIASVGSDTESEIEAEDPQVSNRKGSGSSKPEEPPKPTVKATKRAIAVEPPTKVNVRNKAVHAPGAMLSEKPSSDEEELPVVSKAPIKKVAAVKEKASPSKSKHPKKVVAASAKSEMTGVSAEEHSEVDSSIRKASVGSDTESDIEAEDPKVSNGKGSGSSKPEEPESNPTVKATKRAIAVEPPTKVNVRNKAIHAPGAPVLSEKSSSDDEELPVVPKAPMKKVVETKKKTSSLKSKHPKKVVAASAKSEMTGVSAEEDSEVDSSFRKASVGSDTESDIEAEDPKVSNGKGSGSSKPEEPESKPTVKATKRAIAVEPPTKANVGREAVPGAHVLSEKSSSDDEELPVVPKAPMKKVAAVKEKASSSKSKHHKKVVEESAEEDSEVDNSIRKVANALKEKVSESEEEDRNLVSSHHDEEVSPKKKRQKSSTKQSSSGAMRRQTTKHVKPLTKKAQPSSKVMAAKPKQGKANDSAKVHRVAQEQLQDFLPVIRETLFEAKLLDSKQGLQALKYLQEETIPKLSKLLLLKFPELIETLEEICGMKNSRVFKEKSKTIKLAADHMLTGLAERFGDGSTKTFLEAFAKESADFKEMTRNVQRHKIDAADTMEDLEKLIEEGQEASMTDPDGEAEGSASDETSETENEDVEEELSDEDEAAEEDENGSDDDEDEAVEEDEDEDENEDEDDDGLRF